MTETKPRLKALERAIKGPPLRRSIWIMLIVGTVLTLINQREAIFAGSGINVLNVILTYLVPLCVSFYAAWSALVEQLSKE